ncbi:hypothetical protein [Burkholderia cepacia]|uniref:hypothetical protein n=1 Tax=Burkholderia cepacia TaxID=292 RepID=UPI002AB64A12|nr:hypothetical protein [Burkholderia cepacia]
MNEIVEQIGTVVIYNERDGVFLGTALGLGFWSKLECAGQDAAATFESEKQAREFMSTWITRPDHVRFVPVVADCGNYASISSCVAAGLPAWNPND